MIKLIDTLATLGLDPEKLLADNGPFGKFATVALFAIIFAESGLLVGFFLPGDSLLFVAGLIAAGGGLAPLPVLLIGCAVAAIAGDQVGYSFGKRMGPALFRRPDSHVFKQAYVHKSTEFFERHGAKTILLARFVPIVRTFAPIVAGVGEMRYRTFLRWNVLGGTLWAAGFLTLGYAIGDRIPWIKNNIELVALGIVALSLVPAVIEIMRHRRDANPGLSATEAAAEIEHLEDAVDGLPD